VLGDDVLALLKDAPHVHSYAIHQIDIASGVIKQA
jgi:hypothetical protein